jgi:hypothetical protein
VLTLHICFLLVQAIYIYASWVGIHVCGAYKNHRSFAEFWSNSPFNLSTLLKAYRNVANQKEWNAVFWINWFLFVGSIIKSLSTNRIKKNGMLRSCFDRCFRWIEPMIANQKEWHSVFWLTDSVVRIIKSLNTSRIKKNGMLRSCFDRCFRRADDS